MLDTTGSKTLSLILLLSLFVALFYTGKWGFASAEHSFAMWYFDGWQKSAKAPDVRTWKWVDEAMRWSLKLDPDNAEYCNDMGRLYAYKAMNMVEYDSQIQPLLAISLSFFGRATRLSPAWAIAWANLALLKHRMGSIDTEFYQAMDRAMLLGAGLPSVQRVVAEAGIAHWRKLPVAMRRKVLHNIHVGLGSQQQRAIVSSIAYYRMSAYFCKILPASDQHFVCKKVINS